MTADEMFKKLGYEKCLSDQIVEAYNCDDVWYVAFRKDYKLVDVEDMRTLHPDEIIAIAKKCEELGWIK